MLFSFSGSVQLSMVHRGYHVASVMLLYSVFLRQRKIWVILWRFFKVIFWLSHVSLWSPKNKYLGYPFSEMGYSRCFSKNYGNLVFIYVWNVHGMRVWNINTHITSECPIMNNTSFRLTWFFFHIYFISFISVYLIVLNCMCMILLLYCIC